MIDYAAGAQASADVNPLIRPAQRTTLRTEFRTIVVGRSAIQRDDRGVITGDATVISRPIFNLKATGKSPVR